MTYQVSIFLENKLGHLERVTSALKDAAINIRSMHLNHTTNGWGILSLVVSDPALAVRQLDVRGMSAALREIVVVRMCDQPGGLDALLKDIVKAGINFTNAYGSVIQGNDTAFFVIDIQDFPGARAALERVGLEVVPDTVVYGI